MGWLTKIAKLGVMILAVTLSVFAHADRLDDIQQRGYLLVGTTGDYKPFSYYDGKNYSGYDIDVAKYMAKQLNVDIRFVKTTWKGLIPDLQQGKFDIAMGGITRRIDRQLAAEQTQGYMTFGKLFLVQRGQAHLYNTLAKVNNPKVRVGVNIGGTNEKFADQYLNKATLVKFEDNLAVPKAVLAGKVDLMVTETPEALYYQTTNPKFGVVRKNNPFTKSQFTYLIGKGEQRLLNTVNFLMDDMRLQGIDQQMMQNNHLAIPK
ncbi:transporter substrate-binding domain-containing protein [Vibrio nitrifigilis]|nr:transporter substrate-binding domain-containing protein [Vibrio nitrifigilis]